MKTKTNTIKSWRIACDFKAWMLITIAMFAFSSANATNYYWVGGSGSWSDYASHWATSSGGNVYHVQIPTPSDDVYIDANSFLSMGDTLNMDTTILQCRSMDWTGVLNKPHLKLVNNYFSVYGSLVLADSMTMRIDSAAIIFKSSTGGNVIHTAGHELNQCSFQFDGTGAWTFISDFTGAGIFYNKGNLSINAKTVRVSYFSANIATLGSSLDISGSTIYVGRWQLYASLSNQFFTGGSTIHFTQEFYGGKKLNYNTVVVDSLFGFQGTVYARMYLDSNSIGQLNFDADLNISSAGGSNSYSTVSVIVFNKPGLTLELNPSIKMQTNFILANGTCANPINIRSSVSGTQATIIKTSGSITCDRITLNDIEAIGGANFVATNSYDFGNVSGWTINTPTPRSLYWVGGTGNWSDASHWSTVSGGAGSGCVPGPTDDIFFDANSFSSSGGEFIYADLQNSYCKNFTSSGTSSGNYITASINGSFLFLNIYGSLNFDTAAPKIDYSSLSFKSSNAGNTIKTSGKMKKAVFEFNGTGSWMLQDSLTCQVIQVNQGSLNTNNKSIICDGIYSNSRSIRAIDLGTSEVKSGVWQVYSYNSLSLIATAATIQTKYGFLGGRKEHYHILKFDSDSTVMEMDNNYFASTNEFSDSLIIDKLYLTTNVRIHGTNTFDSIIVNNPTGYISFQEDKIQTITGGIAALNACQSPLYISSFTAKYQVSGLSNFNTNKTATLNKASGTISVANTVLKGINAIGGATFLAINSYDAGFNSGWSFNGSAPRNLYWVGGSGRWNEASHWALGSGFSGGECPPRPMDNVFFDASSFSSINDSVVIGAITAYCKNMDWTGATQNPILSGNYSYSLRIFGSLTLSPAMTFNPRGEINFESNLPGNTIKTNGTFVKSSTLNFAGSGAWTQTSALESDRMFQTNGTYSTNNYALNLLDLRAAGKLSTFNMETSTIRSNGVTFTDSVSIDADSSTIFLTVRNGFSFYYGLYSAILNAHYHHLIFDQSSSFIAGKVDKAIYNSRADIFSIQNLLEYDTLIFNNPGEGIYLNGFQGDVKVNNLLLFKTLPGFPTLLQGYINSFMGNTDTTSIEVTTGSVCADYLYIENVAAKGGATFNAGIHSSDLGGNSGWSFTSCVPQLSDVWPGDANSDMVANNLDLLNIGLAYGDTGYVRPSASLAWIAQPATDWFWQFISGVNVKHTDCDGDGIVNADDTTAILQNYGLTHPRLLPPVPTASPIDPSLYFTLIFDTTGAGTSIQIPINLGTASVPAVDVYGVAFTVNYDKALVDSGSVKIDFNPCWLGTLDSNIIAIQKDLYSNGKIEAAIVGIDHVNKTGFGPLGILSIDMKDDISGRDYLYKLLNLSFSNVHLIRNDEIELPVNVINDSIVVVGDVTGIASASVVDHTVSLSPNPAKDNLTIDFAKAKGIVSNVSIYNAFGEIVYDTKIQNQAYLKVNTQEFSVGVYFVKITTNEGVITKKLTVIE
jgi:Secretion system C-terminal sorting domain